MKAVPLKDNKYRIFLTTDEYIQLLESAYEPPGRSARQVRLEMRLMACSMRLDTVSEIKYGQFEKRQTPEGVRWVAVVEGKDSTEREAETRPRAVFVPDEIMDRIHARADRRNLSEDDMLFPCSTRTIGRDVKRSAKNAFGEEQGDKVSAHDLRRYFATHLLFRHEVPAPVVRMLGGWMSDEAMLAYLILPDDVLFTRLGEANVLGAPFDTLSPYDQESKIDAATDRLSTLVEDTSDPGLVEYAGRQIKPVFEDIEEVAVKVGINNDVNGSKQKETPKFNGEQQPIDQYANDDTNSDRFVYGSIPLVARLRAEIEASGGDGPDARTLADKLPTAMTAVGSVLLTGLIFGMIGIRFDPSTMAIHVPSGQADIFSLSLFAGTARVLWKDYRDE